MSKIIEAGNTKVEVTEENGIVSVKILSTDAVVYMNEDMIWSIGNEQEEFKYIPKVFHSFLLKQGLDYLEYDQKEKTTVADVYIGGASATFYFPLNQQKNIAVRVDLITSLEETEEYFKDELTAVESEIIMKEISERFNLLRALIESKGYKLKFSHGMKNWVYGWWDVILTSSNWNEESFMEIMEEVSTFNKFLSEIEDKYS